MHIRFAKSRNGPTLVCTRADGTITGMKSRKHGQFFVRHDLMHYAVETVLGFRQAFWGLLAGLDDRPARSIESFLERGASRHLPAQAIAAEFIVGRLDQAAAFRATLVSVGQINAQLRQSVSPGSAAATTLPEITQKQLGLILHRFTTLWGRFEALSEGDHLDVEFPLDTGEPVFVDGDAPVTSAAARLPTPNAPAATGA